MEGNTQIQFQRQGRNWRELISGGLNGFNEIFEKGICCDRVAGRGFRICCDRVAVIVERAGRGQRRFVTSNRGMK